MVILFATDFSDGARAAGAEAGRLARAGGDELLVLHVLTDAPILAEDFQGASAERAHEAVREGAVAALEAEARAFRDAGVANVRTRLEGGVPHEEIARVAAEEDASMIVVGTHGRGGLARFLLGSVTDRLLRTADRPVLCVRRPEA